MMDHAVSLLQAINIIDYSYWFTYMNQSCISDIKPIWLCMYDFYVFLYSFYKYFINNFCVCVHQRTWFIHCFVVKLLSNFLMKVLLSFFCVDTRSMEEICGSSIPHVVIIGSAVCTIAI